MPAGAPGRVAAVDCGTNSLRLLVADAGPVAGRLTEVLGVAVVRSACAALTAMSAAERAGTGTVMTSEHDIPDGVAWGLAGF